MHLTASPVDWYAARAGGVVAYLLLSAVVVLGVAMGGKKNLRRWPRFAVEDVHRFGGLLVGTFVAIHVGAVAIDSYLPFSVGALVVPFVSRYRPLWVALGIVAAELLLALAVTNHYRHRGLSHRSWRRAHYLNFAVWTAATLHGLGSGTDRSAPWLLAVYAVAVGGVSGLVAWRLLRVRIRPWRLRRLAAAAALLGGVAVVAAAGGPLRAHAARHWNASSFRDTLTGKVETDNGVTRGLISLAGEGKGEQRVLVRADLLVAPGRLVSTTFQMEYLPSGLLCRGHVTRVQDYGFNAICAVRGGRHRFVRASWSASPGPDLAGGILTAHA
jgi:methionine sulfoxide reductase heme-binding subunit